VQFKTSTAAIEPITTRGVFSAIAASYSVDRQGERIAPGAFAETIARWRESGKRLPVHYDHKAGADHVIGAIDPDTMQETDAGLYVEGKLDIHTSDVAREAWRSMKNGAMSLSIGYLVTADNKREDGVRELRGIDLFEVSIVPHPASPDTRVLEMKSERPIQVAVFDV
jgi:HK97 family phage prohead protease